MASTEIGSILMEFKEKVRNISFHYKCKPIVINSYSAF